MTRAYHYTNPGTYKRMLNDGKVLRPRSPLVPGDIVKDLSLEIPNERYIFCFMDDPRPESWVSSGWFDHFMDNFLFNKYALLGFEIGDDDAAFVVDSAPVHNFLSSLFNFFQHDKRRRKAYIKYIHSITPLKDYQGNFEMPELLVAQNIPFSRTTLEGFVGYPEE